MRSRPAALCLTVLAAFAMACSNSNNGGGGGTPTTPTTPTPQANRNPSISTMSVMPAFGIAFLTPFQLMAAASDPDGDALTYQWMVNGQSFTGPSVSTTMTGSGQQTVSLAVTDGKGGNANGSQMVTVGNMTGTWNIVVDQCNNEQTAFIGMFTQNGGTFSGTFNWPFDFCAGPAGLSGAIPSDALATIDASGKVSIRLKAAPFIDFFIDGQMDNTGRTVTGQATGSGLDSPARLTKQ